MKENDKAINRNVIMTGLTSFFTDISSEMVYPLLQGFLTAVMKAQSAFLGPVLGLIEGIAESTASLLKVTAGYYSDRLKNRKIPAIIGYLLSALSRLLFFIPLWSVILTARFTDRVGKGIRTAPRDALISESVPRESRGRAFGFQRAMDFAGAFLGSLLCLALITFVFPGFSSKTELSPAAFYPLFAVSLLPAFLGVVFLFFTREPGVTENRNKTGKPRPNLDIRRYDRNLRFFFLAQFIFTLGNSSNQFLLLRSGSLGYSLAGILALYIVFNLTTSLFSTFFGSLSDRSGRKKLLMAGYSVYALVYILFGLIPSDMPWLLWLAWPLYGIYYAMTEGIEKAMVSDLAPEDSRATALGFYHTITGIALLPASVIAGLLYSLWIPAPFLSGGFLAFVTVAVLFIFVREPSRLPA